MSRAEVETVVSAGILLVAYLVWLAWTVLSDVSDWPGNGPEDDLDEQ